MTHPHKGKAAESSREKFRAITGKRGGGHAHAGASHNKKPGAHGVLHTYDSHTKAYHPEARAHGGRSKPRADTYARGGRTGPKNVTINITAAQPGGGVPPPLPQVPPPAPPVAPPPAPPPSPPGGAPGAAGAGGGANPLASMGKGMGMGGFKRGGRIAHATKAQPGDSRYDMTHWKKYAADGRVTKAKRIVQGHTQSVDKVQERARGGRMTAGAMSGVGRLEQAHQEARRRGKR